jgi:beta-lysine 5,6-aminomutase alpha subunit
VQDLFVEPQQIERCRELAAGIAAQVQRFIDAHTTASIERTVLRLFGIGGTGSKGAPLANLVVDRLLQGKLLGKGAAWWLGRALREGGKDPVAVLERLAAVPGKIPPLAPAEDKALRDEMRREARAAVAELKARVQKRNELKASLQVGEAPDMPWKYVIVATGNIHEDVEQARAAAQQGADVIAVIRSTAQSLLDYVPHGATTEGYGGTYATQENFHIMREALDEVSRKLGRYVHLTNYSSGLCMPEIAFMGAWERLDMLLNDAMYGILFRDINMRRTWTDQHFSRRICALAGIIINTGEDNYITTADAYEKWHTVIASHFINVAFAHYAGMPDELIGLGHGFEIDHEREDSILFDWAQAALVRRVFPRCPIKYMPPTKHKQGDIFFSHAYDVMADVVAVATRQRIQLLGMMTEAMHTPFLQDRFEALKAARYIYRGARHLAEEIQWRPDGRFADRQREVLDRAMQLLEEVAGKGMVAAIGEGIFGDVARAEDGGKGHDGVVAKDPDYFNPFLEILEAERPRLPA